jgi:hypothetical protein
VTAFTCYCTGHIHSRTVMGAFAAGAGLPVVPPDTLRAGGVAVYGILRGTGPLLRQAQREQRNWIYLDNGYFKPGHYDGFFRVTCNAYQFATRGKPDLSRLWRLGVDLKPWRKTGRHVLVCPPSTVFAEHMGVNRAEWLTNTTQVLVRRTDREIRVRIKPIDGVAVPLQDDLRECHAVVTLNSNVAVEALVAGVPVFCHAISAASPMARHDVNFIEEPGLPDGRLEWAATLAANQWTLAEMRDGTCAKALGIA